MTPPDSRMTLSEGQLVLQGRCPWCGVPHVEPTVLCKDCEAEAVTRRLAAGLTVKRVPSAGSDTDD